MVRSVAFRIAFSVVVVAASGGAQAETRLLEVPSRYLVIPRGPPTSKHLVKGDVLFEVPLRWRSAAVLSRAVALAADERRVTLQPGQSLVESRLTFDDPAFSQSAAFCVPRLADPLRKNPLLGMGVFGAVLARSTTDGQFCIIDQDHDGIADHSVLINAGSPTARIPAPIAPASYTLTEAAAVSEGDSFKITFEGGRNFVMAIIQQGKPRRFDTLTFIGPDGRKTYERVLRAPKMSDGTIRVLAPGVMFSARNSDGASIDVEWPGIAETIALPIPDDVKTYYRGY